MRSAKATAVAVVLVATACTRVPGPGDPDAGVRGAVVAIDPGHPSDYSAGTKGATGLTEAHVDWEVGRRVRDILVARGVRVVMTKASEAEVVSNRRRAEIANEAGAALLVRLHCDSRRAPGTATYYPDRQGTAEGATGPTAEVIAASERAARIFHPALIRAMGPGWGDYGVLGDSKTAVGARQGALTGSIFARVPALTVEMVSLSNAQDEAFIATAAGQERMAAAVAEGVIAYLRARARDS